MISGVIGGCVCGMVVWLYLSSREEGGLAAEYFVKNTGKVIMMLKLASFIANIPDALGI